MNEFVIIGANYGNAGNIKGAEKGSEILKKYIVATFDVEDGNTLPDYSESTLNSLGCIEEFKSITNILQYKLYENLCNGKKVITIGGDHSIALGTIWGASDYAKKEGLNFGVIYIDAHGDINDTRNSITKNIHGMPLAYSIGIENYGFDDQLPEQILNPSNLLYIGTRSLDDFEKTVIDKNQIQVISANEINNSDIESILRKIYDFIKGNNLQCIHLSIDIDVVDPIYAPGTGVPEKNGIHPLAFMYIIKFLHRHAPIQSIDVVEFNPFLDIDRKTEYLCQNVCANLINGL